MSCVDCDGVMNKNQIKQDMLNGTTQMYDNIEALVEAERVNNCAILSASDNTRGKIMSELHIQVRIF